jgi:hypothetical protein
MNFSQFLSENPEIPHVKQIKPQPPPQQSEPPKQQSEPPQKPPKKVGLSFNKKKTTEPIKERIMTVNQEDFKKGDFIIITRLENSPLNVYKGYFGEIKEIIRGGETAIVVLEAMSYPRPIRFPMGHFKRRIFNR